MKLDPEERILLTEEDFKRIQEACENPGEPKPALVAAIKRYRERFTDETKT